ncbi:MAG: proteasome accessory factor PafA2 family protein [Chthoniobacteraceae bacterium]
MNSIDDSKPPGSNGGRQPSSFLNKPIHVPKLVGSDIEFANTLEGIDATDRCTPAGWALLAELPGLPNEKARALHDPRMPGTHQWPNERDLGRRFVSNGSCFYMDSGHTEGASCELLSARQHVAWWAATQRIVSEAQARANAKLPAGQRLRVAVRNSDGFSNSFGSHDNFLITRPAWERMIKHPPTTAWLASFQVSSIVLTGAGKLGSENGRPACRHQLSQRADFCATRLLSEETMFDRPIINTRDEPHCGPGPRSHLARLHCIMHDANLCPVAQFLKIGTMQIALTMIEAGEIEPKLCLADPASALVGFSHDPSLNATAKLKRGDETNIVDLQLRFLDAADRFVGAGRCAGLVPDAEVIIAYWAETLSMLKRRDFDSLAGRLDWVHRLALIEGALAADSRLSWDSPALRLIDFAYGDIDGGMFLEAQQVGLVEQLVTEEEICAAMSTAPENTRAWTRSRILQLAPAEIVAHVDWDSITLREKGGKMRTLWLGDPLGFAKANSPIRNATTFEEALKALQQDRTFEP